MTAKIKKRRVRITLTMACECGLTMPITDFGSEMRVTPGYTSSSGTGWPGEIEIRCPKCGGVDDSRTV